jgi:galactokinase
MKENLLAKFNDFFGEGAEPRIFFAPGRVNLIGEHTDYNGGFVFPAALTIGTYMVVRPRRDGVYRFRSMDFDVAVDVTLDQLVNEPSHDWVNYPKGVLSQLLKQPGLSPANLSGADVLYKGTIPNGAGLSSSASIELVTALAFSTLAGANLSMIDLVKLSQRAENVFVGVNCGIMDQFAVGMGKKNHAVMLNCDTLDYDYVPIEIDEYQLVIINTNKRRTLADSKYNERRQECEQGLEEIQAHLPSVQSLGDVKEEQLPEVEAWISNPTVLQRVRHVVTENSRVLKASEALNQGDLIRFGDYMKQSHVSLRDDYEVTGHELDSLFDIAKEIPGCIGTRMTGAGFGGCNVSLVRKVVLADFKDIVTKQYHERTGLVPHFYVCDIGDGTRELTGVEVG